jgi:hypothetical protein
MQFDNADHLQMFREEYPHLVERVLTGADHAIEVFDLVADIFRDYWDAGAIRVACVLPKVVSAPALGLYEYSCLASPPSTATAASPGAPTPALAIRCDRSPTPACSKPCRASASKSARNLCPRGTATW